MSKTYISAKLRRQVIENARNCCEYCLQPELFSFSPHEIDHAISEKHGGKTLFINLALACKRCNTYKGSDIASIDPETQMTTGASQDGPTQKYVGRDCCQDKHSGGEE
jgi:hypothetical protein